MSPLALRDRLKPQTLIELCERELDQNNVSEFQRPFVVDMMRESLQSQPYSLAAVPVDVVTFVESPEYLDKAGTLYPKVMEALVDINAEGRYDEAVLTGGIGCVDKDTEFLSPTGWVPISEWAGEEIAQVDESGRASFVHPEYVKLPCDEFISIKNKYGVDQRLSPEHRVYYRTSKGNWRFTTARQVEESHTASKGGWRGDMLAACNLMRGGVGCELTNAEMRVQCMVQADGHFRYKTAHCTVRVLKSRKVERAEQLLQLAGIEYTKKAAPHGYTIIRFYAPLRAKTWAWAWGVLSVEQMGVIAEEVFHWDGTIHAGARGPSYFTTIEDDADFVQFVLVCSGIRARKFREDRPGEQVPLSWTVRAVKKRTVGIQGTPKTPIQRVKSEDGFKYCFHVPTGLFLIRRNGCVVVTGNSGKTTLALYTTAYQLYRLSLYKEPHKQFSLDPASEIVLVFQSLTATAAKEVDFDRFRELVQQAPYFRRSFQHDKDIASKLVFPNRIVVKPISGTETAAIGQNVIGGILDEVNYMAVTQKSSLAIAGGTYDQAVALYNSIARRRKSRFLHKGRLPGLLCLVSSKRYPGQFTDVKEEESKTNPRIYVYDKRTWEVKPPGTYSGENFSIFIGDEFRKPYVMKADEKVKHEDRHLVMAVPVEHHNDFSRDMLSALREIAGVSTLAIHPFIHNTDAIGKCIRKSLKNLCMEPIADFVTRKVRLRTESMKKCSDWHRWVHIDLGITSDSAGICMGHVEKFVRVKRGADEIELLPLIYVDMMLEVAPPLNGEINFAKIREMIYLMSKMGVPIRWVTYDSFQSRDSLQILRGKGYTAGLLSMDKTPIPYDVLKSGLYDNRVRYPEHDKLVWELSTLERDPKTGKVDHPAASSKDLSDALAGMVYGLSTRREVYAQHEVSPQAVPQWLLASAGQVKLGEATEVAGDAVISE